LTPGTFPLIGFEVIFLRLEYFIPGRGRYSVRVESEK
jgi:hypothetical protein